MYSWFMFIIHKRFTTIASVLTIKHTCTLYAAELVHDAPIPEAFMRIVPVKAACIAPYNIWRVSYTYYSNRTFITQILAFRSSLPSIRWLTALLMPNKIQFSFFDSPHEQRPAGDDTVRRKLILFFGRVDGYAMLDQNMRMRIEEAVPQIQPQFAFFFRFCI